MAISLKPLNRQVLDAAVDATRDVKVGAMSKLNTVMAKIAPSIADRMAKLQTGRQQRDEPPHTRHGALFHGSESGHARPR
jgi:hypothetical protein